MAVWGYWRTSTTEQQSERQEQSLKEAGCERIYGDQITGTSAYGERPELSKCLDGLRDGDTLVIHELDPPGALNGRNACSGQRFDRTRGRDQNP